MVQKLLIAILFFALVARPLFSIYQQQEKFFARGYSAHYQEYKQAYESSQYVKKNNPGIIPDQTLESYAGGAFLKGVNPIHIIHDQPPLGRYLIALSILVFDNQNTIIVIMAFLSVIGLLLIAYTTLKNIALSLLAVSIFTNEPLFLEKLVSTPLLEPIQLTFIIFSIYFFMKGVLSKTPLIWFLCTSLMLGGVIGIRFFILGVVLIACMCLYFFINRVFNKYFLQFLLSLPLALVVLFVSYFKTIQEGYSLLQIVGVQKYIFLYHKSKFILPFTFWDLLMFNRWHTWWGDWGIASDPNWIIVWPIVTVLTVIYLIFVILKRYTLSKPEIILYLWVGIYTLMLSMGYTSTRYFLPFLPFLYILAIMFLKQIISKRKNKK